jgi:uncharacterized protein with HEPN domain
MSEYSHKDFSCILNIIDSINKIQEYSRKFNNPDDFYNDSISFDATMMNFIVIGEMADKLSNDFVNDTSSKIDWPKVKGFRNIIAHNYFGIDAEEVWQIIQDNLLKLKIELERIIK